MIITILFLGAAGCCVIVMFLLFSPLQVNLRFFFKECTPGGTGRCSFFHPMFFAVHFDFATRDYQLRIFGRLPGKKSKKQSVAGQTPPLREADAKMFDEKVLAPTDRVTQIETDTPCNAATARVEAVPVVPKTELPDVSLLSKKVPMVRRIEPDSEETVNHRTPPVDDASVAEDRRQLVEIVRPDFKSEEKMVSPPKKRDNWFDRLQRNRYFFFIRNSAWRGKILRWLLRFFRALFHIVRFDRLQIAVRAGVEDPMLVGVLTGFYQAAVYGLSMKRPYSINFEPVFMKNYFEGSGRIRVGTSLFQLLLPALIALVTFPMMHTLWLWWRYYRMEKHRNRLAAA